MTSTHHGTQVVLRPEIWQAMVLGLVVGAVAFVAVSAVGFFVVSILGPVNLGPGLGETAAAGALLGVLIGLARVTLRRAPGGRRKALALAIGLGLAAGLIRIGFATAVENGVTASYVVANLASFTVGALFVAGVLPETRTGRIRRDLVENSALKLLRGVLLAGLTVLVAFPFYFMVSLSFKSRAAYLADPTNLSIELGQPLSELFRGFTEVLTRFNFALYIVNSTAIALLTVVVTLTTGILGAYAVTRLRFRGRRTLSKAILLIYMFPAIVLVIPLYSVFTQLGLRNTRPGLLIVYSAMTIPVALYMLRSYFQTLPADLEEAGLIDGCSRGQVIWRITIPLSGPAIASVGLYVFMIAWNEFLFAFMFLDTPAIFTLSRGMVVLDDMEVPRQYLMAGATIITIPIMVLFFRFQRYLVGGLTAGGVKS